MQIVANIKRDDKYCIEIVENVFAVNLTKDEIKRLKFFIYYELKNYFEIKKIYEFLTTFNDYKSIIVNPYINEKGLQYLIIQRLELICKDNKKD